MATATEFRLGNPRRLGLWFGIIYGLVLLLLTLAALAAWHHSFGFAAAGFVIAIPFIALARFSHGRVRSRRETVIAVDDAGITKWTADCSIPACWEEIIEVSQIVSASRGMTLRRYRILSATGAMIEFDTLMMAGGDELTALIAERTTSRLVADSWRQYGRFGGWVFGDIVACADGLVMGADLIPRNEVARVSMELASNAGKSGNGDYAVAAIPIDPRRPRLLIPAQNVCNLDACLQFVNEWIRASDFRLAWCCLVHTMALEPELARVIRSIARQIACSCTLPAEQNDSAAASDNVSRLRELIDHARFPALISFAGALVRHCVNAVTALGVSEDHASVVAQFLQLPSAKGSLGIEDVSVPDPPELVLTYEPAAALRCVARCAPAIRSLLIHVAHEDRQAHSSIFDRARLDERTAISRFQNSDLLQHFERRCMICLAALQTAMADARRAAEEWPPDSTHSAAMPWVCAAWFLQATDLLDLSQNDTAYGHGCKRYDLHNYEHPSLAEPPAAIWDPAAP